jgi:hypothetical protein
MNFAYFRPILGLGDMKFMVTRQNKLYKILVESIGNKIIGVPE